MGKGRLQIERRRHERLGLSFLVVYRLVEDTSPKAPAREAKIADISRGGVRLVATEAIAPGAFLGVKITLLEGLNPIKGKARVIWQRKKTGKGKRAEYQMGLRFKSIQGTGDDLASHAIISTLRKMFSLSPSTR